MISLKTKHELEIMRQAGRICAQAMQLAGEAVQPGVTTGKLDKIVHDYILSQNAVPSFLGLYGFPGSACISVNEELIHGIPGKRVLHEGDIVSLDLGACYNGYHSDMTMTFPVGEVSEETARLLEVTRESLNRGIAQAVPGNRISDISHAVQSYVEANGYAVVTEFVGHGVGASVHEDPEVPNYDTGRRGARLMPGMVIAIEPMVNVSGADVKQLANGWTVVPKSGSLSAHFEHTVAITESGPVILTRL